MNKKILLLGGPVFQRPVVSKAKAMGLRVGVVDISEYAPAASLADDFFRASIKDYDATLDICRSFHPDAILSGACDTSVVTVARLCEELGLPGNSVASAVASTDKVTMLESFAREGVASPKYEVVRKAALDSHHTLIDFPVITKPTDSAAGRGVNVATNAAELRRALKSSSEAGLSGDVLVEELMRGSEVSVEVLVVDGTPHVVQITDKLTSGAPHFFETGHIQPSSLSNTEKSSITDLASRAVLSVGLVNSAAHVGIMLTENGPKMVELGARCGGGWITSYLIDNSVTGVDFVETMILLALGVQIGDLKYNNSGKFVATRFLPACKGRLVSIDGASEALSLPGVVHVELTGVLGKSYTAAVDDSARFASVVATGNSKAEALDNCESALNCIRVVIE